MSNELEAKKNFYKNFKNVVESYRLSNNLSAEDTVICPIFLQKVYEDSKTDINFITKRRLPNGASDCKIAGILLWRLSKTSILRFIGSDACKTDKKFLYMNFHLALMYVCKYVLHVDIASVTKEFKSELSELKYLIENRHTNQEMIALFFQLICHWEYCCNKDKKSLK